MGGGGHRQAGKHNGGGGVRGRKGQQAKMPRTGSGHISGQLRQLAAKAHTCSSCCANTLQEKTLLHESVTSQQPRAAHPCGRPAQLAPCTSASRTAGR